MNTQKYSHYKQKGESMKRDELDTLAAFIKAITAETIQTNGDIECSRVIEMLHDFDIADTMELTADHIRACMFSDMYYDVGDTVYVLKPYILEASKRYWADRLDDASSTSASSTQLSDTEISDLFFNHNHPNYDNFDFESVKEEDFEDEMFNAIMVDAKEFASAFPGLGKSAKWYATNFMNRL